MLRLLSLIPVLATAISAVHSHQAIVPVRFAVSIDRPVRAEPASERILFLISRTEKFAPGVNGTPVFGKNVDDLKPGDSTYIDESAFGYPVRNLRDIPEGEYFVQAWLNVYTTFRRSDGRVIKLHMDQGEGQNWPFAWKSLQRSREGPDWKRRGRIPNHRFKPCCCAHCTVSRYAESQTYPDPEQALERILGPSHAHRSERSAP